MEFLVKRTDFYRFYAKKSHIEGQVRFLVPTCSKCQNSENHDFWPLPRAFIKAFKRQLMWFFGFFWGTTRFLGTQKVIFTNFLSNFSLIRHGICNWSWFCCFRIFHHFLPKFSLILSRKKCKNPQNRQNPFLRKIVLRRF